MALTGTICAQSSDAIGDGAGALDEGHGRACAAGLDGSDERAACPTCRTVPSPSLSPHLDD